MIQAEILALRHQVLVPSAGQPGSTNPVDRHRQTPLELALTIVDRVAICSADRQKAWVRALGVNDRQVHGPPSESTFADLAHISGKSHK
jgi:hypothetical protein